MLPLGVLLGITTAEADGRKEFMSIPRIMRPQLMLCIPYHFRE
jgi:hypothetical protein